MVIVEENKIITLQECDRQFIKEYTKRGYSKEIRENCLRMYVNGLGFRAIERVTGVNHNTVIRWVRKSSIALPNAPEIEEIPEITEIDELQTYVGQKKQNMAQRLLPQATLGESSSEARATTVNHWKPGILAWVLGDRSSKTFKPYMRASPLWEIIRGWQSFWYVTRTRMRPSRRRRRSALRAALACLSLFYQ